MHSGKPIVPPRPRNFSLDHHKSSLNSPNIVKTRGNNEAGDFPFKQIEEGQNERTNLNLNVRVNNFFLTESSQVYNVINTLFTTTTAAVQLHAKLKSSEDTNTSSCSNNLMLKELENALIMAQNMLTCITINKFVSLYRNVIHIYNFYNFIGKKKVTCNTSPPRILLVIK